MGRVVWMALRQHVINFYLLFKICHSKYLGTSSFCYDDDVLYKGSKSTAADHKKCMPWKLKSEIFKDAPQNQPKSNWCRQIGRLHEPGCFTCKKNYRPCGIPKCWDLAIPCTKKYEKQCAQENKVCWDRSIFVENSVKPGGAL